MKREFRNYLVTGGLGFIGSNYINFLNNAKLAEKIINIDAKKTGSNLNNIKDLNVDYFFYQEDIQDINLLDHIVEHDIDVVVHFAAESHVDRSIESPEIFIKSNIMGTYNLLECVRKSEEISGKKIHFHHVSTDEIYGSLKPNEPPFNEKNQLKPNSPYSSSKASSDHLVRAWNKTYGLNTTISNCSNNYGPCQHHEKLIPKVIKNALSESEIPIYGDGKNIRDWLFVEDHCFAIQEIISKGRVGETYNVGGKNEISNNQLVEIILDCLTAKVDLTGASPITNKKFSTNNFAELIRFVKDRKGHDFRYSIESKKIEDGLNWLPKHSFEQGIIKTIDWYLGNIDYLR